MIFLLQGRELSVLFSRVVFCSVREILLECPVPSPSKFPALFNCSPEIPAWLGRGGGAVHEAGEKLAKNGESNAALPEQGVFVVVAPCPRLQISSQREMGTVWDEVGASQHV